MTNDTAIPSLREAFREDFTIGAAVNAETIHTQRELLAKHFGSVTAENEMKFENVHPSEDVYTFEAADRIAAFAREHGMKLRGHTLVWHNQTPAWMFQDDSGRPVDKMKLLARMKLHIEKVVGRYKDDIYCWDVVNEAVSDEGPETLRRSPWLDIAGPDFIAKAFEYAHEADPKALLFYNDYNEINEGKRERIYALVRSLVERGVPIHGIGLQAHWSLRSPAADDIRAAIERYAELGLKLQITEMDLSVFDWEDRRADLKQPTPEMLSLQAERYETVFRIFREYREVITGVTFWGAADDYTWLDDFPVKGRKNWPFLFDEAHRPKPAFARVIGPQR